MLSLCVCCMVAKITLSSLKVWRQVLLHLHLHLQILVSLMVMKLWWLMQLHPNQFHWLWSILTKWSSCYIAACVYLLVYWTAWLKVCIFENMKSSLYCHNTQLWYWCNTRLVRSDISSECVVNMAAATGLWSGNDWGYPLPCDRTYTDLWNLSVWQQVSVADLGIVFFWC